jgi:D-alanyl-D-alanine carboxypeptidase
MVSGQRLRFFSILLQSTVLAFNTLSAHAIEPYVVPTPKPGPGISSADSVKKTLKNDRAISNENLLYMPASTSKIFTATAALKFLGEDFRYQTPVRWKVESLAQIQDLTFYGGGDPTWVFHEVVNLQTSPFKSLVQRLKENGVKKVIGPIYFDSDLPSSADRRGALSEYPQSDVKIPRGWDEAEKYHDYLRRDEMFGIIPSSFFYHFRSAAGAHLENAERLWVQKFGCSDDPPVSPQQEAYRLRFPHVVVDCDRVFSWDPELKKISSNGELTAIQWDQGRQKYIYSAKPSPNGFLVKSSIIPLTAEATVIRIREHFIALLRKSGILYEEKEKTVGERITRKAFHQAFVIQSEPLTDILQDFMRHSINRIGESLVIQIGLKSLHDSHREDGDAYAEGLRRIREHAFFLSGIGSRSLGEVARTEGVRIDDGCGLSRTSRVSPRFMVQVLEGISQDAVLFPQFQTFSAVAGGEGTLGGFSGSAFRGKVVGKTGTLNDAFNVVGFIKESDKKNQIEKGSGWIPFAIFSGDKNDRLEYLKKIVYAVNPLTTVNRAKVAATGSKSKNSRAAPKKKLALLEPLSAPEFQNAFISDSAEPESEAEDDGETSNALLLDAQSLIAVE